MIISAVHLRKARLRGTSKYKNRQERYEIKTNNEGVWGESFPP